MPNRFIKESCRSSRNLDRLTDFEERVFWRLITTADDFGRFMSCPELVRAACFPYRKISISSMTKALTSLQSQKLIKLYRVDGREYGIFATWEKHQGKPRASKSKYPEALDSFLQADESGCEHLLANAPGGPNTNTDTNTDKREGSGEGGRRKGKRPISEEDKPSEKHFAYGQRLGVDVGPEWGKFYNYCKAHDRRYADFDAAFRNWLANAANFTKKVPHAVR